MNVYVPISLIEKANIYQMNYLNQFLQSFVRIQWATFVYFWTFHLVLLIYVNTP